MHLEKQSKLHIQYGLEHEGEAIEDEPHGRYGLTQYFYRPPTDPDSWINQLSSAQRMDIAHQAAQLLKAPSAQYPTSYDEFFRIPLLTTKFLDDELSKDGQGDTHEITTRPTQTLYRLMKQARWFRKHIQRHGGRLHFHQSFLNDPGSAQIRAVYAQHVSEYIALRMYAGSPLAVMHSSLSPYTDELTADLITILQNETPEPDKHIRETKYTTFAVRTGIYKDPKRIAFEVRGITNNLVDARRVLVQSDKFLRHPDSHRIRLGYAPTGRDYSLFEVADVDRLGEHAFLQLSSNVQDFFEFLEFHVNGAPMTVRWSLPMVKWEERAYLPKELHAVINHARQTYIATVEQLCADFYAHYPQSVLGGGIKSLRLKISQAVHEFAKSTQLHQYF